MYAIRSYYANYVEEAIRNFGISSPLMIMKGDGGVTSMNTFKTKPILTILSGPAASVAGRITSYNVCYTKLLRINIENQNLFASGEEEDTLEFWVEYEGYREWQKGGQILAGVILGTSLGALFGIVFALSRNSLPGNNDVKKALVLAGIMWLTIYFVPFLKYPANPPSYNFV